MNRVIKILNIMYCWCKQHVIIPAIIFILNLFKLGIVSIFILFSINFSYTNNVLGALITTFFAVLFLLLFYNSNFKFIEVLGIKISLKELTDSLKELKELSKVLSEISLYNVQSRMRLGRDLDKNQEFFMKIDTILNNVKIPQSEKETIYDRAWHNYIIFDYYCDISSLIEHSFKDISFAEYVKQYPRPKFKEIDKYTKALLEKKLNWGIEQSKEGINLDKINAHLDNFDYYVQHRCFKNFELRNELAH